jgi:hypothetical protein
LLQHEAHDDLEHAQRRGQASMAQAASMACWSRSKVKSVFHDQKAPGLGAMKTPESRYDRACYRKVDCDAIT